MWFVYYHLMKRKKLFGQFNNYQSVRIPTTDALSREEWKSSPGSHETVVASGQWNSRKSWRVVVVRGEPLETMERSSGAFGQDYRIPGDFVSIGGKSLPESRARMCAERGPAYINGRQDGNWIKPMELFARILHTPHGKAFTIACAAQCAFLLCHATEIFLLFQKPTESSYRYHPRPYF